MKKVVVATLLFVFLSADTSFGQLLRLPALLHHYREHSQSDHLTFLEFLQLHYSTNNNHPSDPHHDHEKLPFKNFDCQLFQIATIIPHQSPAEVSLLPEISSEKIYGYQKRHHSKSAQQSIWQPPKHS
ncbi:MAG: hypothetical protein U0T73_08070 [Chitinophagales bacterium]